LSEISTLPRTSFADLYVRLIQTMLLSLAIMPHYR
jgi:hypothetical protein